MFKYQLDQLIYYMANNQVHSAPVLSRMYVDSLRPDWNYTPELREIFTPFGESGAVYATCHGKIPESKAFGSPKELMDSLC